MMGICRNLRNIPNVLKLFCHWGGLISSETLPFSVPICPQNVKQELAIQWGHWLPCIFFWKFCVCKVNEAANNYFRKNNSSSKQNICAAGPLWYYLFWFLKKRKHYPICHLFDIFVNMFPLALLVEVNDPSKPSHCCSNGPGPSKTIETNG